MALSKIQTRELINKSKGLLLSKQDRKAQIFAYILLLLFIIPVYILGIWVLPFTISAIIKYGVFALLMVILIIAIYYFLAQKIPSSDRICRELALLENEIEYESYTTITKTLGDRIYRELNPALASIDINQTDLCKELLNQNEVKNDSILKFHIYLKLYRFYFMSESFDNALNALKSALDLDAEKIIVRIWLAEAYEYTGNGEKAIELYKSVNIEPSVSSCISSYIDKQIERINHEGPRKAPPLSGLRYMTY